MSNLEKILTKRIEDIPQEPWLPKKWRRPRILLCANTVKPMHGVVPRVILGEAWWNQTREAAYQSTQQRCLACGVPRGLAKEKRWLEGHELYETDYLLGRMTYMVTVPLCHYCHCFIHDSRLRALVDKGEIPVAKLHEVSEHGNEVLRSARIKRPPPYTGPIAVWEDWRLVLYGKEYPPLYPTFEAWKRAFGYA